MTYFLDTNLLVYALDGADQVRLRRANAVLLQVGRQQAGGLSTQILAEYCSVVLRKNLLPTPDALTDRILRIMQVFPVLPVTPQVVQEAVRGVKDYRFSYYDAQVWAVARLHSIPVVLSEDFNHGATIEEVTFLNPLSPNFDIQTL